MSGAYESNDHFQLGWCAHACSAHCTTGARSDTDLACYLMYFRWHMIRLNDLIIVHYLKYNMYMISNRL